MLLSVVGVLFLVLSEWSFSVKIGVGEVRVVNVYKMTGSAYYWSMKC